VISVLFDFVKILVALVVITLIGLAAWHGIWTVFHPLFQLIG
jgi:hypothetical protein